MRTALVICLGAIIFGVGADHIEPDEFLKNREYVRAVFEDSQRIKSENPTRWPGEYKQNEVCFDEIGCFSKVDGPFSFTSLQPESPEKIGTTFSLYTADTINNAFKLSYKDKTTLETSLIDPELPLAVVSHGLNENGGKEWVVDFKKALLDKGFASVIVVDWAKGAILPFYGQAMVNTEVVGRQLALILEILHKNRGLRLDNVHLLGYSLGAHLSGITGKTIYAKLGQKIGRITGFDPAGPNFEDQSPKTHLSYHDATYVDVIHSSAGSNILSGDLGIVKPIGHVDYYPNGGRNQPGCGIFTITCSHSRALRLFLESMTSSSPCIFTSYPCPGGYNDFKAGKCKECGPTGCGHLGLQSHLSPGSGSLYLQTRGDSPYCRQ